MSSPLILRLAAAGLGLLLSMGSASVVGAERFGEIALALFIAKISPVLTCGAGYGYIKLKMEMERGFSPKWFSSIYLLNIIAAIFFLSLIVGNKMLWFSVALAPAVAIEPVEKTNEKLHYSFVPEILCFAVTLIVGGLNLGGDLLLICTAAGLSGSVFSISLARSASCETESSSWALCRGYWALMRSGFMLQIVGTLLATLLYMDRFFISKYWTAGLLGVFMLAYQLAQGASFPLQSFTQLYLLRFLKLKEAGVVGWKAIISVATESKFFFLVAISAPILAICVAYFFVKFSMGYDGLLGLAFLLILSSLAWAACSALLPRLFYEGKMFLLFAPLCMVLIGNVAVHLMMLEFTLPLWMIAGYQCVAFILLFFYLRNIENFGSGEIQ